MKNNRKASKVLLIAYIFIIFILSFSYFCVPYIPSNIQLSFDEFNEFNSLNSIYSVDKKLSKACTFEADCDIKLFGILKVKRVHVSLVNDKYVYAGGLPIGIEVKGNVKIATKEKILTEGNLYVVSRNNLQMGDTIISINGNEITTIAEYENVLQNVIDSHVNVKVNRNGKIILEKVKVYKDILKNKNSLGLILNESTTGIGTLTFINENMDFGALGHPISLNKKNEISKINGGNIYLIKKISINKAYNGVVGRFSGDFLRDNEKIGSIDKNTLTGIYGEITNKSILNSLNKYQVGSSYLVKSGKAKILSYVTGKGELYDIEIIKKLNTRNVTNKCMVIRITDRRLLNKTGGIIQGMSGSPIIQNERIVGAVTHVFVDEPTKGYGVYIDYMI